MPQKVVIPSSDPRKEDAIVKYKAKVLKEDEIPPDAMAFAALFLGIIGMFFKV